MLSQRVGTALVLLACLFGALFFSPYTFFVFVSVLVAVAAHEWAALSGANSRVLRGLFIAAHFLVIGAMTYYIHTVTPFAQELALCVVALWVGFLPVLYCYCLLYTSPSPRDS